MNITAVTKIFLVTLLSLAQTVVQADKHNQVISPELVALNKAAFDQAWVNPGHGLAKYKQLIFSGVKLKYKEVESKNTRFFNRRESTEFPISEKNKKKLGEIVNEVFKSELGKSNYFSITEKINDDVLLLQVEIIEIESHIPPETVENTEVFVNSVGEGSLILELRDAGSGQLIARASDHREAKQQIDLVRSNNVIIWSEVRRLSSSWARLIRKKLEANWNHPDRIQL